MPFDNFHPPERDDDDDEPRREVVRHAHPALPFVQILQERYADARPEDAKAESWSFEINGPAGSVAYDGVSYSPGDSSEPEMLAFMAKQAERHLLDERGPFFVLRLYLESGQYRNEVDTIMRQHGQSPALRRAEAAVARYTGFERSAIRMRYRLRGERPSF